MAACPDWGEIDSFVLLLLEELGIDTSQIELGDKLAETEIDRQDLAEVARVVSQRYGARVRASDFKRAESLRDVLYVIYRKLA
jgi:hypothetical protein